MRNNGWLEVLGGIANQYSQRNDYPTENPIFINGNANISVVFSTNGPNQERGIECSSALTRSEVILYDVTGRIITAVSRCMTPVSGLYRWTRQTGRSLSHGFYGVRLKDEK